MLVIIQVVQKRFSDDGAYSVVRHEINTRSERFVHVYCKGF